MQAQPASSHQLLQHRQHHQQAEEWGAGQGAARAAASHSDQCQGGQRNGAILKGRRKAGRVGRAQGHASTATCIQLWQRPEWQTKLSAAQAGKQTEAVQQHGSAPAHPGPAPRAQAYRHRTRLCASTHLQGQHGAQAQRAIHRVKHAAHLHGQVRMVTSMDRERCSPGMRQSVCKPQHQRMRRRAAAAQHSTARPSERITAQPSPAAVHALRCCAQRRCHFSKQQHTAGPASEHASGATKPKMAMACTAGGCGCSGAEHSVGTAASAGLPRPQFWEQQPAHARRLTTAAIRLFSTSPGSPPLRRPAPAAGQSARCAPQSMRRRTADSCVWAWEDRPVSTDGILSSRSRSQTGAAGVPARTHVQQAPQALAKQQQSGHNNINTMLLQQGAWKAAGCRVAHSPVKAFGCSACSPSASPGSPVPPLAATVGREQMAVCNRRACPA